MARSGRLAAKNNITSAFATLGKDHLGPSPSRHSTAHPNHPQYISTHHTLREEQRARDFLGRREQFLSPFFMVLVAVRCVGAAQHHRMLQTSAPHGRDRAPCQSQVDQKQSRLCERPTAQDQRCRYLFAKVENRRNPCTKVVRARNAQN